MKEAPLNKILLAAVIILAVGEGYLLLQRPQGAAVAPSTTSSAASSASAPQAPITILTPLSGTVKSISGNTLTLSQRNTSVVVSVPSGTTIVKEGTLKDAATYQADLEKFHQQSDLLMQDPQKNQSALETLISPSRYVETTISLSQVTPGEQVAVFTDGQSSDGTYDAFRIAVTPQQQ